MKSKKNIAKIMVENRGDFHPESETQYQ